MDFVELLRQIAEALKGAEDNYYNGNTDDLKNAYNAYVSYVANNDTPEDTAWTKLAKKFEPVIKAVYTDKPLSKEELASARGIADELISYADNIPEEEEPETEIEETVVEDEDVCPQCGVHTVKGTCPQCHLNVPLSKKFTELLFKPRKGADGIFGW